MHASIVCKGSDEPASSPGGFHTGEITELVGPSTSGKTQICLSAAVHVARNRRDKVAYIDSSSSLHPSRLQEIYIKTEGNDPTCCPVLFGVRQYMAHDVEGLFTQLDEIETQLDAVADAQSQDEVGTPHRRTHYHYYCCFYYYTNNNISGETEIWQPVD